MTTKIFKYESSEPVAPGGSLKEFMDVQGISAMQLAKQANVSLEYVTAVLAGKTPITTSFADDLAQVVGMTAMFWLRYDANYQRRLAGKHQGQLESE